MFKILYNVLIIDGIVDVDVKLVLLCLDSELIEDIDMD